MPSADGYWWTADLGSNVYRNNMKFSWKKLILKYKVVNVLGGRIVIFPKSKCVHWKIYFQSTEIVQFMPIPKKIIKSIKDLQIIFENQYFVGSIPFLGLFSTYCLPVSSENKSLKCKNNMTAQCIITSHRLKKAYDCDKWRHCFLNHKEMNDILSRDRSSRPTSLAVDTGTKKLLRPGTYIYIYIYLPL